MKIQTYNLPLMQFFQDLSRKEQKMLPSFEKKVLLGDDLFEV